MAVAGTAGSGATASAKKQSMSEIKLRRLSELNIRLKEDLERPRVKVSEACESLIAFCKSTKDHMVPSVWGPLEKHEDRKCPCDKPHNIGANMNCSLQSTINQEHRLLRVHVMDDRRTPIAHTTLVMAIFA
jgi:guanine nucleotide-binding protein subunit gamma